MEASEEPFPSATDTYMTCIVKTADEIDIDKVIDPDFRRRKSVGTVLERRSDSIFLKKLSIKATKNSSFNSDPASQTVDLKV